MANPIHVNPATAARRLTVGGSDWCWVVTTIMVLSALGVFVWSKVVGLFYCYIGTFFTGTCTESNLAAHERFITLLWLS